jgi:Phage integrase, N-terminal SAM-like domain/Phage integrase family
MSPQSARMIDDMILGGLAEGARKLYVQAVRRVAAHSRRSPDLLSEEEVRSYLLGLRQRGVARGTFQTSHYGLRFFYRHTLGRVWELFGEKRIASPRQKRLRTFAAAVGATGIQRGMTPHSYAARLVENGVHTRIVQILLGHASIATTAIYTHLTTPTRASLHSLLDRLMTGL